MIESVFSAAADQFEEPPPSCQLCDYPLMHPGSDCLAITNIVLHEGNVWLGDKIEVAGRVVRENAQLGGPIGLVVSLEPDGGCKSVRITD